MDALFQFRTLALAGGGFFSAGAAAAQPAPPQGKQWVAVSSLTDEFDAWDASKWAKSLWNYGEPVQMVAANSGVANGNLWIKATLDNTSARWFKTSRVMSKSQIRFPMYTECRMKTAHISAYNTFWLNNGNSENRDEIDICENNSKPSIASQTERPYTMYSQYFLVENAVTERAHGDFDNRNLSNGNPLKGVKWNEAYHTLGAWWKDKNTVQFYLDGEPAGKVVTTRDFTRYQNIIWDLWTTDESWAGGLANQSDLTDNSINTMYVDWIHTYSLVDKPPSVSSVQTVGSDFVMQVTDGVPAAYFSIQSSPVLAPAESWTTIMTGLQLDSNGARTVVSPVSGDVCFFRVAVDGNSAPDTIAATFDWSGASTPWWSNGYGYMETRNGVTLVAGGRASADSAFDGGVAFKASYSQDSADGTFKMRIANVDKRFSVSSIDIKGDSGNAAVPAGELLIQGVLGGVEQWFIDPVEDNAFHTYNSATSGNLALEIDQIVWKGPYDPATTNPVLKYQNRIDNLSVRVLE